MAYILHTKWHVAWQRHHISSKLALVADLTSEEKGTFVGLDLVLNDVGLPLTVCVPS